MFPSQPGGDGGSPERDPLRPDPGPNTRGSSRCHTRPGCRWTGREAGGGMGALQSASGHPEYVDLKEKTGCEC